MRLSNDHLREALGNRLGAPTRFVFTRAAGLGRALGVVEGTASARPTRFLFTRGRALARQRLCLKLPASKRIMEKV